MGHWVVFGANTTTIPRELHSDFSGGFVRKAEQRGSPFEEPGRMVRPGYCADTVTLKTAISRRATTAVPSRGKVPEALGEQRPIPDPTGNHQPSNPAQKRTQPSSFFRPPSPGLKGARGTPGFTENTPALNRTAAPISSVLHMVSTSTFPSGGIQPGELRGSNATSPC